MNIATQLSEKFNENEAAIKRIESFMDKLADEAFRYRQKNQEILDWLAGRSPEETLEEILGGSGETLQGGQEDAA